MNKQELTYWITLALIPKMWTKRKNEIYVNCFQHVPQISIVELFEKSSNWDIVGLNETEKIQFEEARLQLANNSFLVEDLMSQGYDILPVTHEEYPKLLKKNLKFNAPVVIYIKGNKSLLKEEERLSSNVFFRERWMVQIRKGKRQRIGFTSGYGQGHEGPMRSL